MVQRLPSLALPLKAFGLGGGLHHSKNSEGLCPPAVVPWNQDGPYAPPSPRFSWLSGRPVNSGIVTCGQCRQAYLENPPVLLLTQSQGMRRGATGTEMETWTRPSLQWGGSKPGRHSVGTPFPAGASGCPGLSWRVGVGSLEGKRHLNPLGIVTSLKAGPQRRPLPGGRRRVALAKRSQSYAYPQVGLCVRNPSPHVEIESLS